MKSGSNSKTPAHPAKEVNQTREKVQSPSKKHESKRTQDIRKLAKYLSSGKCKKIVLMLGAGVSTSAGIPDFRSPKTGLYSNLQGVDLPYPEALFEINFFRRNPVPFYTFASELYPGFYRPTLTHSFIKLLASRKLLHLCFTQNIDTLERRAGVPPEKIVEAHGSFATQHCVDCGAPFPDDEMRKIVLADREGPSGFGKAVKEVKIPRCLKKGCGGLVKPDIVFFGESLPKRFIEHIPTVGHADLLLIIGTSLTVHPFASLAEMADRSRCQRVLINLDCAGDLGRRPSDTVLLGECDEIVKELCDELGWGEELERMWGETALKGKEKKEEEEAAGVGEGEIEKVTEAVEKRLSLEKEEEEALEVRVTDAVSRQLQIEKEKEEQEEQALEKAVKRITEAIQKQLKIEEEGQLVTEVPEDLKNGEGKGSKESKESKEVENVTDALAKLPKLEKEEQPAKELPEDLNNGEEKEVKESKEVEDLTDALAKQPKLEEERPELNAALASQSPSVDSVPGSVDGQESEGVKNETAKSSGGKL